MLHGTTSRTHLFEALIIPFYDGLRTYLFTEGATSREPLPRSNGLLQGCPYSVMLLAVLATAWASWVEQKSEGVAFGIYIDDKVLWALGEYAANTLKQALDAAHEFDNDTGAVWNRLRGTQELRSPGAGLPGAARFSYDLSVGPDSARYLRILPFSSDSLAGEGSRPIRTTQAPL